MAYTVAMKRQMEKRLEEMYRDCIDELNAIEIPFGKIVEITVNYKAKSRWGLCTRLCDIDGYIYKININADLCHPDASEKGLKETIIHEILHTCPHCMCHTGEWKRLAELVNDCYGYNVKRADSSEDKGMDGFYKAHEGINKQREWKYTIRCNSCGKIVGRKRRACKITMYPQNYRCASCHGTLKVIAS